MGSLSVIVPLGPNENAFGRLAADLLLLPGDSELVFVACRPVEAYPWRAALERVLSGRRLRWIEAPEGRARQMNAAAVAASGDWLWFLHWDSGFGPALVSRIQQAVRQPLLAMSYARLQFMDDGPAITRLNARLANWRSRWLGVPFGDQGFVLPKELFVRVGGFDEAAAFGEDHLLVWQLRLAGVPLIMLDAPLLTSARKYRRHGWSRLTLRYQWMWMRQAWPYAWQLVRSRLSYRR
ncbi:hypothetical protein [Motiliproteus sediminis]|uniref:hypothetical protein n=1 Tax=Motiliproteus sediminis TaxID=1468178 RepID=UPI001AEF44BA|nr:hypothetical protein [Motiliproteus sediminis]